MTTVAKQLASQAVWCDAAAPSPPLRIRDQAQPTPGRLDPMHELALAAYPLRPVCGSPNLIIIFSISLTPCFPGFFSVSPPRHPCATVPSYSSVHTRTERACSSHFPELNSEPLREGTQERISGPRPWPESDGLCAVGVRAPINARARTRSVSTNRFLPTPHDSRT